MSLTPKQVLHSLPDSQLFTCDTYAIFGHPIAHSLSPCIHLRFAEQTNQTLDYLCIEPTPNEFEQTLERFFLAGGAGANISIPFKHRAAHMAVNQTPVVLFTGSANTLWHDEQDKLCADSTDGIGLLNDLTHNLNITLQKQRVLLIGTGGAAHAVLPSLLDSGLSELWVTNRNLNKARAMCAPFTEDSAGTLITVAEFSELSHVPAFDLIINATSSSTLGIDLPLPSNCVASNTVCYDMAYLEHQPRFLTWCLANGAQHVFNGLGMLVEQACASFTRWRQIEPATAPVIAWLRSQQD